MREESYKHHRALIKRHRSMVHLKGWNTVQYLQLIARRTKWLIMISNRCKTRGYDTIITQLHTCEISRRHVLIMIMWISIWITEYKNNTKMLIFHYSSVARQRFQSLNNLTLCIPNLFCSAWRRSPIRQSRRLPEAPNQQGSPKKVYPIHPNQEINCRPMCQMWPTK